MSEIFNEYYDIDAHSYLRGASVDLVIEYLKEQIESPYEYQKRNYVDEFIGDYNFSKKSLTEDYEQAVGVEAEELQESLIELEQFRDKFINVFTELMYESLSLGFAEFDDTSIEFQNKVMSIVYKFFILNIKRNYKNLCLTYIEENKNELAKAFKRSGDMTALAQKNRITDSRDITILSSLRDIIRQAILIPYDIDQFVLATYGNDPPEYDQILMKELIDNDIITGNFVPLYLKMVTEEMLDNIEFEIRYEILNQYATSLNENN